MQRYYYIKDYDPKKKRRKIQKRFIHISGITFLLFGVGIMLYYFSPLFLWKLYVEPSLSTVHEDSSQAVLSSTTSSSVGTDASWLPADVSKKNNNVEVKSYRMTIPSLQIHDAVVSTVDTNLTDHLVQYWRTPIPPHTGDTVIFGHSTLPQLFDANDYKTIFANISKLKVGDNIFVTVNNHVYIYQIFTIYITNPTDLSVLLQKNNWSYLTIVTCTPPGTTWKRLIVKSQLIKA